MAAVDQEYAVNEAGVPVIGPMTSEFGPGRYGMASMVPSGPQPIGIQLGLALENLAQLKRLGLAAKTVRKAELVVDTLLTQQRREIRGEPLRQPGKPKSGKRAAANGAS